MRKLTHSEIARRLQEGRNYKHLYHDLKGTYDEVKAENKELRQLVAAQQTQLETQALQIAELQTMVFGKQKRPLGGTPIEPHSAVAARQPRTKASYRRPIPPATALTAEEVVLLSAFCTCGGRFSSVTIHDRYEEDIPLPELTPGYQSHLVTKYRIERGVCLACGKATASKALGGAKVSLGPNVRLLVAHLIASAGLSYSQVTNLLSALYGLNVSDGEIAHMLRQQHIAWTPAYNQLKADIRSSPVRHYDETPWKIQREGGSYAWVMSASESPKSLFHLATSRGTRHARDLHGKTTGVHISDDYGPYRNLPGQQQLCWAHLYRSIRDLRHNANLAKEQLLMVTQWYEAFASIYQDLRNYLNEPYDEAVRRRQCDELWQRTRLLAAQPVPPEGEPDKLSRLRAQLLRAGQAKLFTCLLKDTPL